MTTHRLGFPWQDLFVFVLQLALISLLFLELTGLQKELAGDEDAQNFPYPGRCSGLTEDPTGKCLCLREKTEVTFKT